MVAQEASPGDTKMGRDCRRFMLAAAALTLLAGAAGAQTLTLGVRAGPESIDPHFTATGTHAEALKHVFDTLTHSGDQLQIEPGIAESWRVIDPTTWEFRLRRGVKFHDGSDMTAEDVAASIRRMQVLSGPNPTRIYVRRVQEVRIVDPHTIHVVTSGPSPTLPNDFIRVFITKAALTEGLTPETANEAFNSGRAAIGTGPYRFGSWTPREQFTVERFDGYWGGRPAWARHVRRGDPERRGAGGAAPHGQVDMIVRVPAADVPTLERDRTLTVVKADTVYVFNLQFDFRETTPQVTGRDGSRLAPIPSATRACGRRSTWPSTAARWPRSRWRAWARRRASSVTPNIFGFNPRSPMTTPGPAARAPAADRGRLSAGLPHGAELHQ
jgi:peptide/nickel transport system substrate-binding protein